MELSNDLLSQFAKVTNDNKPTKQETTVYGTIKEWNGGIYVQLDGSDLYTPYDSSVDVKPGERVSIKIKDHTATVTGNLTSPAARVGSVDDIDGKVSIYINTLKAESARINTLVADNVKINETLVANKAVIDELDSTYATIENLEAANADIKELKTEVAEIGTLDAKYATIKNLEATNADIHNLEATFGEFQNVTTNKLDANTAAIENLDATYANIDFSNVDFSNIDKAVIEEFFSKAGMIEDLEVGDGTISGTLVGVTIKGDLIEGGTVVADKLVVKGEDGLYYKLNTDGVKTEAEQTDYNSLNGSIITAKSITASKISVKDLVAFGATIGGFKITDDSIYSGVKESVDNTTRGVYMDDDGQFALGDVNNYLKFYKDSDGNYRLAVSADSMIFSANKKSVEDTINDAVDNLEIGGRNLLPNSSEEVSFKNAVKTFDLSDYGVENIKNKNVTISFDAYTDEPGIGVDYYLRYIEDGNGKAVGRIQANDLSDTYKRYSGTIDTSVAGDVDITMFAIRSTTSATATNPSDTATIYVRNIKVEIGDKPTDWTPAPEDMATADELSEVDTISNDAKTKAESAQSAVAQLSDSLNFLVSSDTGGSYFKQDDQGNWYFTSAETEKEMAAIAEALAALSGSTDASFAEIRKQLEELNKLSNWVKISTDGDQPSIELGEKDSNYKTVITNTDIKYYNGSIILATFDTEGLKADKVIVKEELNAVGVVFRRKSNGYVGIGLF